MLEYENCPFLVTEDGIESQSGCMCGIHPKPNGKPQHECIQITCRVWEIIQDLDRSGDHDAQECDRKDDVIIDLKEKLHQCQEAAGIQEGV